MAKSNILEPPVLEILDLEALADDAEAIPALMKGLRGAAEQMGAAKLRIQMVSPRMLERLGDLSRRARREGGWGHCHVRFAPGGPDQTLWSPTPYDGDYAMCLRPVPARAGAPVRAHAEHQVAASPS
ncbi:MAG: N-acetyltransferase, partial [Brevundimonas sp.]|nr:N-acetyltransferase [Brevundimonas sp.]